MNFPFELSEFQTKAIQGILDGNHVLVTAHTGSGKTLPAEFAIQHFVGPHDGWKKKRVIYTSPIKALSNQKYYDFTHKYPEISFGLLTGDIKTNPNADVLIMTTEILLNKLCMNNKTKTDSTQNTLSFEMNLETDLAAVIFDECHYINDAHRGHVWEQTMLMLPKHVQMIMLSATIDAPDRFAKWIESHSQDKSVILCSTDRRVVPLTHYMYATCVEGFHKRLGDKATSEQIRKSLNRCVPIQSAEGGFQTDNYNTMSGIMRLMEKHDIRIHRKYVLNELVTHLRGEGMLPAIVFVFSRKAVEQCAAEITVSLFDEEDATPNHKIRGECEAILHRLPNWREYESLPEYVQLISLLEKGIGIHHSGMLPVLREIVELMIGKKYIKLLFATESFAIGLDCPIKTAVFLSLQKYDGGQEPRYLMGHEYTQMAGRAGRRGIDTIGNVIHCVNLFPNGLPALHTYKEILSGKPQILRSKFKIDYKMFFKSFLSKSYQSDSNSHKSDFNGDVEINNSSLNLIKQSLLANETNIQMTGLQRQLADLEAAFEKKTQGIEYLSTSTDIVKHYNELQESYAMAINKRRKEIERAIKQLEDSHRNIKSDSTYMKDLAKLKSNVFEKQREIFVVQGYFEAMVSRVSQILCKTEMICVDDANASLTSMGAICPFIAEVNPVLMSLLCKEFDDFADFTTQTMAAFLSIFTDVRIYGNNSVVEYSGNYCMNETVNSKIQRFDDVRIQLIRVEEKWGRISEDLDTFCYDIADDVLAWTACETEEDCKRILTQIQTEKGISIGDFSKALLKISTIARELMTMCDALGKTNMMKIFDNMDRLLLKYVVTNQSLYL